jgi:hypothetical protein
MPIILSIKRLIIFHLLILFWNIYRIEYFSRNICTSTIMFVYDIVPNFTLSCHLTNWDTAVVLLCVHII